MGRVVRLDSPSSIDVVNNNGGGIYTIKTTQASREAAHREVESRRLHHRQCVPDYRRPRLRSVDFFGKGLFGC